MRTLALAREPVKLNNYTEICALTALLNLAKESSPPRSSHELVTFEHSIRSSLDGKHDHHREVAQMDKGHCPKWDYKPTDIDLLYCMTTIANVSNSTNTRC